MATLANARKYTLRFNSSMGTGSGTSTRSVTGLNFSVGTAGTGPNRDPALQALINTLRAFTLSELTGWRFLTEQEVIF